MLLVEPRELAPLPYAAAGAVAVDAGPGCTLARIPTSDGALFTADRHQTLIDADLRRGHIRAYTSLPRAVTTWAPHLVRQAMTTQQRAAGAVHAHAAAITVAGIDILIAGLHGTGKTAAVLACLRHLGGDLVTDSRLLLSCGPAGLVGRPWPVPLTISSGALLPYPEIRMLLGAPDARAQATGHTITIGPGQTDMLLTTGRIRHEHRPQMILRPELDLGRQSLGSGAPVARPVNPDEFERALIRTRLFMHDPGRGPSARIDDWISDPLPPTEARSITPELRAVVEALAQLETYRISVTPNPLEICEQVAALLPTAPIPVAS